jgi:hypothetical protein
MERIAVSVIVALVVLCAILYAVHLRDVEENASLKKALDRQSAMLAETQAELALRDEVIKKRDEAIAEAERKAEAQEGKYARLVRANRVVQEWDAVRLPDDVRGLLKGSANSADRTAGNADGGSGNP